MNDFNDLFDEKPIDHFCYATHPNCGPMEMHIQDFMIEYLCLDCGEFFSIGDMSYKKIEMCPHCQSSADRVQRIK